MRTTRNTGSSRTFQRRMAYKGTSSIILFQTVCNQQGKKGLTKAENVEICDEGDLLSVLLQEDLGYVPAAIRSQDGRLRLAQCK